MEETETGKKRRPKTRTLLLAAFGLLLALVLALALFRIPLAERILASQLADQGIPEAAFELEALGLSELRIVDLTAGAENELAVPALRVTYDLSALLDGPAAGVVRTITLDRPIIALDLTGQGPLLGSLQSLLETPATASAGPAATIPPIDLANARVEARTPLGPITIGLNGAIAPDPAQRTRADLAVTLDGPLGRVMGSLTGLLDGAVTEGRLDITEGSLALPAQQAGAATSVGGLAGALSFRLRDGQPETVAADLALTDIGLDSARFETADLTLDMGPDHIAADAFAQAAQGSFALRVSSRIWDYLAEPRLDLSVALDTTAEAPILAQLDVPRPDRGRVAIDLRTWGQLPPVGRFGRDDDLVALGPDNARPFLTWLLAGALGVELNLDLEAVSHANLVDGLSGQLAATASITDGEFRVALTEDATLAVGSLDLTAILGPDLPPALAALPERDLRLRLAAQGDLPTRATLRPDSAGAALQIATSATLSSDSAPERAAVSGLFGLRLAPSLIPTALSADRLAITLADLTLDGAEIESVTLTGSLTGDTQSLAGPITLDAKLRRLRQSGITARNIMLSLPMDIAVTETALEAALLPGGRIRSGAFRGKGLSGSGLELTPRRGLLVASRPAADGTGGGRLVHDLVLRPRAFALTIDDPVAPITVQIAPGAVTAVGEFDVTGAYEGRIRLADSKLDLPDLGIAAEGLRLDARLDENGNIPRGSFKVGRLLQILDPMTVPLSLAGTLRGRNDRYEASVAVEPADPTIQVARPLANLDLQYDAKTGRAGLRLPPTALDFSLGGLQPGDLSPLLLPFQSVTGRAELAADLTVAPGPPNGTARLNLTGLSLKRGEVSIQGVDLSLGLTGLQPPQSPPGQTLSVGSIEVGVPIQSIETTFQVLPGATLPGTQIEALSFVLGGGRFSLKDTRIEPDTDRFALELQVDNLALENILPQIGIEGLSGEGGLSGSLPIQVIGRSVVIDGGKLSAAQPGILSYRSAALSSSLPPDADALELFQSPVDLAILALQNFHYDELTITVDKEGDGRSKLFLELGGKNPDVLEGYPFKFNINLTGNVNPILDAVQRGVELSDELLRDTWKLRP